MIRQYLDLSTGHLTVATRALLEVCAQRQRDDKGGPGVNDWPAMTVAAYTYGWFVTVPYEFEPHQWRALPKDLADVLSHARGNNVSLVCFDSDGDALHALPFYEED